MYKLLGILSLLLVFKHSWAQAEYGFNDKEKIRLLKVKNIDVYNYNNKRDSFLQSESKFDTSGNLTVQVNYSDWKHTFITIDSFFYNSNGLLSRKISFNNQRVSSTSFFEYDSLGKLSKQLTTDDSATYTSVGLYDKDGSHSTSIVYINFKGGGLDTMINNSYFNKKGQWVKLVSFTTSTGITNITTFTYDHAGRRTKEKSDSPEFSSSTVRKYKGNRVISQTKSTFKGKSRFTQSELQFSYYPNGLIFQKDFYSNNKPVSVERVFYTYY